MGSDPISAAAHDGEQIDEAALAQQPVEEGLADPVLRGQPPQRGDLVGARSDRCARPDTPRAARGRTRADPRQRLRLGGMVMRPERAELAVEPDAVQVFEAALEMRIALDVVEDVARLRLGQQVKALARLRAGAVRTRARRSCGRAAAGPASPDAARVFSAMPRTG